MTNRSPNGTKIFIGKLIRILITVLGLLWIFNTVSFEKIYHSLTNTRPEFFLVAVFLFQVSVFIRTFRWKLLLQGVMPSAPYLILLTLNYSGSFFDVFLPTGFGGDFIRIVELKSGDERTSVVDHAGIVLLDRFAGLIALFTICIIALPFAISFIPGQLAVWIAIIALGGISSALVLISNFGVTTCVNLFNTFSFTRRLSSHIQRFAGISNKRLLAAWFVSLFFHVVIIAVHYCLSLALNGHLPAFIFFVFTPIVSLALLLPSIQGLGISENVYEYLLRQAGAPQALGVTLGLLLFAVKIVTGLIGGIVYFGYTIAKNKESSHHIKSNPA